MLRNRFRMSDRSIVSLPNHGGAGGERIDELDAFDFAAVLKVFGIDVVRDPISTAADQMSACRNGKSCDAAWRPSARNVSAGVIQESLRRFGPDNQAGG